MPLEVSKKEANEFDKQFKDDKLEKFMILSKVASDKPVDDNDVKKLKSKKINFKDFSDRDKLLYYLAKKTIGYTGADLEALTRESAMLSLRESINSKTVRKKHFEEAFKKIKPSVSKPTIEVYKKIEENHLKAAKAALPTQGSSYLG